jgi:hypothetical protein
MLTHIHCFGSDYLRELDRHCTTIWNLLHMSQMGNIIVATTKFGSEITQLMLHNAGNTWTASCYRNKGVYFRRRRR